MKSLTKSMILSILIIVLSGLLGTGCGTKPMVVGKPSTGENAYPYTAWSPNKKVCILPFENLSKDTDADIKVREILLTELFGAHIFNDIVDLVEANAALMSLRIRKPNSLDKETIRALGEKVDAGYLILGVVSDYGFGKHKDSGARVSISIRMIDVETGTIIWTANHFKKGDNALGRIFGINEGPTPVELTRKICAEIVSSLERAIRDNQYIPDDESSTLPGKGESTAQENRIFR